MRTIVFAFTILAAGAIALAGSQQPRGAVTSLTATPGPIVGNFRFLVGGTNPCSAVNMDFGDGSSYTYAVRALPDADTIWHHYTRDGKFAIRASGAGTCDGQATTSVTVTLPPDTRPARPAPETPPAPAPPPPSPIRFGAMDQNGDRVVSRAEWRGSANSFAFHDGNRDGRLSGDEIRFGAPVPSPSVNRGTRGAVPRQPQGVDWSEVAFGQLDRNRDNRLSRAEWPYDIEDFVRVDRNRDDQLVLGEFLPGDIDDDRGDRFDDLDLNGDNVVDRTEWHGSIEALRWLDTNNDGVVTRDESVGTANSGRGGGQGGGQTGRGQQGGAQGRGQRSANAVNIVVSSRQAWTDTGIDVRPGDLLTIRASGSIHFSSNSRDVAEPNGAPGHAATPRAPFPNKDIGALIGRIGNSSFFVGALANGLPVPHAGRLYLGTNDDVLSDNQGDFRVSVSVSRETALRR